MVKMRLEASDPFSLCGDPAARLAVCRGVVCHDQVRGTWVSGESWKRPTSHLFQAWLTLDTSRVVALCARVHAESTQQRNTPLTRAGEAKRDGCIGNLSQ